LGLTYGYWSISGDSMIWIMGFAAIIGSFINTYTGEKYDSIFKIETEQDVSNLELAEI